MEICMKKPNLLWRLLFKVRMKFAMEQGFKFLSCSGPLTPAKVAWINNEYPDFLVLEDEMDEMGFHYTVFFGHPKSAMEALEYLTF